MEDIIQEEVGGLGDDHVAELEKAVSKDLVSRGKDMLYNLVNGIDQDNAIRIMRMVENIAKHHRELLAAMTGAGGTFKQTNFGLGMSENLYGLGMGNYGNQEENFGAQAIKGLVEGLKKPKNKGLEIESLTKALNLCTVNGDPKMVALAEKLQKRLGRLLDDEIIPLGTIDLGEIDVEVEVANVPDKEKTDAE